MKVIYGIGHLKLERNSCVTVGVFDGMHLGHQSIIKKVVSIAKSKKISSVVITFYPHPDSITKTSKISPSLISLKHRLSIIENFGVDICIVVRFNYSFQRIDAKHFISEILIKRCKMQDLVVNRNFMFGKNKTGNLVMLKRIATIFNFKLHLQRSLKIKGKNISSTLIRALIVKGDLKTASRLLGRQVEVIGTVVGGDSRGRKIGFPTANIDPHHEVIPPKGVYFIKALLNNKKLLGLANIGFRPTFKKTKNEIIELHFLNLRKDIYGKDLRVMFIRKLRNEIRFKNKALLIKQIQEDIGQARQFFSL